MGEKVETTARSKLADTIFLVVVLASGALAVWAAYQLEHLAFEALPEAGRSAFGSGRSLSNLLFLLAINASALAKAGGARFVPARIDPAGNRVLQGVWQDRGWILPSWLGWVGLDVLAAAFVWLYASEAIDNLSGGARTLSYLAGAGSGVVIYTPFLALVTLAGRLTESLSRLRRRPTPAPAP